MNLYCGTNDTNDAVEPLNICRKNCQTTKINKKRL